MVKISPDQMDLSLSVFRPVHAASQKKMTNSLIKYGQLTPVTVVEKERRMILVDGFKRHRSAKYLKMENLKAVVLSKSSSEAKALMYLLNMQAGFSMITEATLIRDLIEVEGLNQVETAILLERHKSWVCRRLQMICSLSSQIVDDIKVNLIPPGVGPSLARLPRDNQADFSMTIQKHGLKTGEVNRLVDLWYKTKDPGVRQHLLDSPRQALEFVGKNKKKDKKRWSFLIETILSRMSSLKRELNAVEVSTQMLQILTDYAGQIQAHAAGINELLKKGDAHEPIN
ncbi:MAG: ParB N-terminal domain-containing protein [Thermodesulfobacteriota bacterium]|nr:ParB N-terminal domain-containing protein [Thermodesulfobacteriota bacterium]